MYQWNTKRRGKNIASRKGRKIRTNRTKKYKGANQPKERRTARTKGHNKVSILLYLGSKKRRWISILIIIFSLWISRLHVHRIFGLQNMFREFHFVCYSLRNLRLVVHKCFSFKREVQFYRFFFMEFEASCAKSFQFQNGGGNSTFI